MLIKENPQEESEFSKRKKKKTKYRILQRFGNHMYIPYLWGNFLSEIPSLSKWIIIISFSSFNKSSLYSSSGICPCFPRSIPYLLSKPAVIFRRIQRFQAKFLVFFPIKIKSLHVGDLDLAVKDRKKEVKFDIHSCFLFLVVSHLSFVP